MKLEYEEHKNLAGWDDSDFEQSERKNDVLALTHDHDNGYRILERYKLRSPFVVCFATKKRGYIKQAEMHSRKFASQMPGAFPEKDTNTLRGEKWWFFYVRLEDQGTPE